MSFRNHAPLPLSSKRRPEQRTVVRLGEVEIGWPSSCSLIAGPSVVESEKQIAETSALVAEAGISVIQANCFSHQLSPYAFKGAGKDGVKLLGQYAKKNGLACFSEASTEEEAKIIAEHCDAIQISAASTLNISLLRAAADSQKPIIVQRNAGATLEEFQQTAEFLLSAGNQKVILCEAGSRTFESFSPYALDFCSIAILLERTHLPVIVNPSVASGRREFATRLAHAARAFGCQGVVVDAHPDPAVALQGGRQSLTPQDLVKLSHAFKQGVIEQSDERETDRRLKGVKLKVAANGEVTPETPEDCKEQVIKNLRSQRGTRK